MNYISAEQFLQAPNKVQKVILDWWKRNIEETDLVGYIGESPMFTRLSPWIAKKVDLYCLPIEKETLPLFTEGQLRHFIEDKTGKTTMVNMTWSGKRYVEIEGEEYHSYRREEVMDADLLQAYWKYACRLAKEE